MSSDAGGSPLRILALEPYYGGSHRAFLDTLVRYSRHEFVVRTMPARKWKWRMRGSAIWFADDIAANPPGSIDLILINDMVSATDLRGLLPPSMRSLPILCYFHENQLTYPLSATDRRDYQFGFTNITTCLASDAVWFNSLDHQTSFLRAAGDLLRQMPDFVPDGVTDRILEQSRVIWPLVESPPPELLAARAARTGPPVILWSHRWEYDKNPEPFFRALLALDAGGIDFELVLIGETFRQAPAAFADGLERLRRRIRFTGFVSDRNAYWRLLADCDLVVSTAIQETFGISIVEAMLSGCRPLLPNRLSYPELIPVALHPICLYEDESVLAPRLSEALCCVRIPPIGLGELRAILQSRCEATNCIHIYDNELELLSRRAACSPIRPALPPQ